MTRNDNRWSQSQFLYLGHSDLSMLILNLSVVFPPASQYGGTPVTAYSVAKAMLHQGHEVFAICTGDPKTDGSLLLDTETEWEGVPVIYCSRRRHPIPFYSPALQRQVASRAATYDIAIIRSSWTHTGPAASWECRRRGVPYLAYPEGNFDPWALRRGRWKKALFWRLFDRRFFEGAAAIVALTQSEAESIRRMGLTNRVEVIPNGVDVDAFADGFSRVELEERLPCIEGRRLILFLGRIHPIKGLPNLIAAFRQIHSQFPDALLVLAGPDERGHQKELQQIIEHDNLAEAVVFSGPVSGKTKIGLLRNSELFVLPSYSEGFPVAVLEALACRLPVVLTKDCHVPEVAAAGAGIEVDVAPSEIAEALVFLLSDDQARAEMGTNGYQLALKRFSWDRVAQKTIDLCAELIR